MTEHLLPGLLELWTRLLPRLGDARAWLGDALRPPEGVEVYSRDGTIVTGILLVDRGRVVGMLGFRHYVPTRRHGRWPDEPTAWDGYS